MTIKVAIVDDQELIRTGLKMIVDSQDDMLVTVEASNDQEALEKLRATKVDVVVMDVRMPKMGGVAATAYLQQVPTPPKVLVLTTFDIDENALAALKAGASGFLLKESRGEGIVEILTDREVDVFKEIATGRSDQEIASALFLSETTVKTHVRSILRKLDLRDRVQIVITAYESGLAGNTAP